MPSQDLALTITQAGFDAFAIMPVRPLTNMLPILAEAQRENRYPDFVDKDFKKRIDPHNLQKDAQSIIALAVSYNTGHPGPTPLLYGTVSRSAWGRDYHHVLNERMDQIITSLKRDFGAKKCSKAVDTSILIDRALAIEAGLGYPGSNCAVYVPPYGSWVFLGEILVDIELPTSTKAKQSNWACPVECDLCIKACPTNALFAPGKIKPQRCISYLTQMSGIIPLDLRSKIGNRLWGCDTCQQACPQNQKAALSSLQEFKPILGPHINLPEVLKLNKTEFFQQFGATSMAWRGKNVIQRNACIVLGNQATKEALPILEKTAQKHPSPMVREAALWAVERI